jgi:hypothetical protein
MAEQGGWEHNFFVDLHMRENHVVKYGPYETTMV